MDIIRKRAKEKLKIISIEQLSPENYRNAEDYLTFQHQICFAQTMETASDATIELWNIINYPPPELVDELNANNPDVAWDALRHYLITNMMWSLSMIQHTCKELKNICS
jgi:hypothetical protein